MCDSINVFTIVGVVRGYTLFSMLIVLRLLVSVVILCAAYHCIIVGVRLCIVCNFVLLSIGEC